jgi:hypothetical protein
VLDSLDLIGAGALGGAHTLVETRQEQHQHLPEGPRSVLRLRPRLCPRLRAFSAAEVSAALVAAHSWSTW